MKRQKISGSWYEKEWKAMGGRAILKLDIWTSTTLNLKSWKGSFGKQPCCKVSCSGNDTIIDFCSTFLTMVWADGDDVEDDAERVGMLAGSKMTQSRWRGTCSSSKCCQPCSTSWSKFTPRNLLKCTKIYFAMCQNFQEKMYWNLLCNVPKPTKNLPCNRRTCTL